MVSEAELSPLENPQNPSGLKLVETQQGALIEAQRVVWDPWVESDKREDISRIPSSLIPAIERASGGLTRESFEALETQELAAALGITDEDREIKRGRLVVASQRLMRHGIKDLYATAYEISGGILVERAQDKAVISIRGLRFRFTQNQLEVWELVAQGLSNEEIARKLGRSLQTVKNTIHESLNKKLKKLGLTITRPNPSATRHRVAILYYYLRLGRIEEFNPER